MLLPTQSKRQGESCYLHIIDQWGSSHITAGHSLWIIRSPKGSLTSRQPRGLQVERTDGVEGFQLVWAWALWEGWEIVCESCVSGCQKGIRLLQLGLGSTLTKKIWRMP
jgi:hypothetical protein